MLTLYPTSQEVRLTPLFENAVHVTCLGPRGAPLPNPPEHKSAVREGWQSLCRG